MKVPAGSAKTHTTGKPAPGSAKPYASGSKGVPGSSKGGDGLFSDDDDDSDDGKGAKGTDRDRKQSAKVGRSPQVGLRRSVCVECVGGTGVINYVPTLWQQEEPGRLQAARCSSSKYKPNP